MRKLTAEDPETRSADVLASNIEQLKTLFPEAVTEGRIDFDVLKQLLGGAVDGREEKYGLNWHGKRRARQLALTPSNGTLRPCPEDSVDWDTTQNLMIEGDNLEVLKLLQKSYAGRVKLIYIDPPYNTGKDFVYPDKYDDNLSTYLRYTGQVSDEGFKTSSNTEASGRFHTNWLNMMYPRLKLAKALLSRDGLIFISIDDGEVGSLREICDDVFGEECLICQFVWIKKRKGSHLSDTHRSMTEYVLAYARTKEGLALYGEGAYSDKLQPLVKKTNTVKELCFPACTVTTTLDDGEYAAGDRGEGESRLKFLTPFAVADGAIAGALQVSGPFVWTQAKLNAEMALGTSVHLSSRFGFNVGRHDQAEKFKAPSSLIDKAGTNEDAYEELASLFGVERVFAFAKPVSLIRYLVQTVTNSVRSGIVLDFFAGSGTTAHAVASLNVADGGNRRFILVQLPQRLDPDEAEHRVAAEFCAGLRKPLNVAEITKERLRRAAKKIKTESPMFAGDLGFRVFKLDSSNIREWDPDRNNLPASLEESVDHLKANRTEADILYELLLKLGLDLCVPIEKKRLSGKDVHSVGGGVLIVCLADEITRDQVGPLAEGIVAWHEALAPAGDTTCVFRDSAFADDVAKTNLAAILEQHGLANVRSL